MTTQTAQSPATIEFIVINGSTYLVEGCVRDGDVITVYGDDGDERDLEASDVTIAEWVALCQAAEVL